MEGDNDSNYSSAYRISVKQNKLTELPENLHRKFAHHFSGRYFYALLTGFLTVDAVEYYKTIFPLCLSQTLQMTDDKNIQNSVQRDEFYRNILNGTFEYLENSYEQKLDDQLKEKALLDLALQEKNAEEYPPMYERLKEITRSLSSGLSAVLALINLPNIYVANTGDTRAFIAKKVFDSEGNDHLSAVSLTTWHRVENRQELQRLQSSKVRVQNALEKQQLGNTHLTKCLGNIYVKKFYKEYPEFGDSTNDPPIDWHPSFQALTLDQNCLFLVLASSSVIEILEWIHDKPDNQVSVADILVKMVHEQIASDHSMKTAAQNVLDDIVAQYNDRCSTTKVLEMSLIVRDLRPALSEVENVQSSIMPIEKNMSELRVSTSLEDCGDSRETTLINDGATFVKRPIQSKSLVEDGDDDDDDLLDSGMSVQPTTEVQAYVDFTPLLIAFNEN